MKIPPEYVNTVVTEGVRIVKVADVEVKVPPERVNLLTWISESPPANAPSACEYPLVPTVTVFPLLCVTVPVYPELILIPFTLIFALIVQFAVL